MTNSGNNKEPELISNTEKPSVYERALSVVIMLFGVVICLGLIGIMIAKAGFDIKLLFGAVVIGPGATVFGWHCFNRRDFWKSRFGKWVKILGPLLLLLLLGIAISECA